MRRLALHAVRGGSRPHRHVLQVVKMAVAGRSVSARSDGRLAWREHVGGGAGAVLK